MNFKVKNYMVLFFVLLIIPAIVYAGGSSDDDSPCPSGFKLTGTVCTKTVKASCRSGSCWCPPESNAKLEGTDCIYTVAPNGGAIEEPTGEGENGNCEDGYDWINGTCMKYIGAASSREGQYYCVNGTLVGTACYSYYEEPEEKPGTITVPENSKPTYNPSFNTNDICANEGVTDALIIIGHIISILKYIVPLIIIVFGMVDFTKAVVSSDDKAISKAAGALIRRVIAGIVIFLVPTIISTILNITISTDINNNKTTIGDTEFGKCTKCIFSPSDCTS